MHCDYGFKSRRPVKAETIEWTDPPSKEPNRLYEEYLGNHL
jgi:hypothetical protein